MNDLILKPGKHILAQGYTGGGKTNLLNFLVQGFLKARSLAPSSEWETLVWFDRGKSSEIMQLAKFAPLRLIMPEGCSMELNFFNEDESICDIEQVHFSNPSQIWRALDRDKINVICIQRFLVDPSKFSPVVGKIFKSLILDSFNYKIHPYNSDPSIMLPRITIFIDEINNLAPSKGQGSGTREEGAAGGWIQQNIEQLRSQGIRLIGSVHGWRKVRPGVRSSFPAHVALPGAYYPSSEKPKLSRFNPLFEKLETGQACFVFEKDIFSDPFKIPWLGEGKELGYILYHGQMKGKEKPEEMPQVKPSPNDELLNALRALFSPNPSGAPAVPSSEPSISEGLF
jgi:hypothetical protein